MTEGEKLWPREGRRVRPGEFQRPVINSFTREKDGIL